MTDFQSHMSWEEARTLLGVSAEAGDEQLRLAYLEQVRQHPPDREPEAFERIRDAYEQLRDPRARAQQALVADPMMPLADLFKGRYASRRFIGSQMWIQTLKAMKETRP